jgi:hypothetical protein
MSRTTITKAVGELTSGRGLRPGGGGRIREVGAGRKKVEQEDEQTVENWSGFWKRPRPETP